MPEPQKLTANFSYSYAEQLALWKEALAKLSTGLEVEVMGKRLKRSELPHVQRTIDWLEAKVAAESGGGGGPLIFEGRVR
jgi:hypothetical protein